MSAEEKKLPKTVKIKGSYCANYNAIHHAQFHRNQFDLVKGVDPTKLKFPEEAMQKWEGEVKEEINLNEKAARSVYTKELLEKDKERDRLLTHLFGTIHIHRYAPVPTTAKAAEKMEALFGKYIKANIQREGFEDESGHIVGLLTDAAMHTTELAALGLTETITQLKTTNEAYEALRKMRRSETVAGKTEELTVLRPKTDASYDYICRFIEASYITATTNETKTLIENLVNEMNQVVTEFKGSYRESLAQKKAPKQPKEPKDPKDPKAPKDPKQPKDPKAPEQPKDPKDPKQPETPKKPDDDGSPDIHLPEE